jgi:hypothetical protein
MGDSLLQHIVDEFNHNPIEVTAALIAILAALYAVFRALLLLWKNRGPVPLRPQVAATPMPSPATLSKPPDSPSLAERAPHPPPVNRVARHIKRLAKLWLWAFVSCAFAAIVFMSYGLFGVGAHGLDERIFSMFFAVFIAEFYVLLAIPYGLIGRGLLKTRPWARTAAVAVSASIFIASPLSWYTLWVLWGQDAKDHYEDLAAEAEADPA